MSESIMRSIERRHNKQKAEQIVANMTNRLSPGKTVMIWRKNKALVRHNTEWVKEQRDLLHWACNAAYKDARDGRSAPVPHDGGFGNTFETCRKNINKEMDDALSEIDMEIYRQNVRVQRQKEQLDKVEDAMGSMVAHKYELEQLRGAAHLLNNIMYN